MSPHKWYALRVASRCERSVGRYLTRIVGLEICIPVQKQWHQWSDRKKLVEVVLFPNYVFVAMTPQHLAICKDWVHCHGVVTFAKEPAVIPDREMELIKKIGQAELPVEISYGVLAPGDPVEIISGPLRHLHGRILSINGAARIQIAIPSLRCFAKVEVGKGDVRRVG